MMPTSEPMVAWFGASRRLHAEGQEKFYRDPTSQFGYVTHDPSCRFVTRADREVPIVPVSTVPREVRKCSWCGMRYALEA